MFTGNVRVLQSFIYFIKKSTTIVTITSPFIEKKWTNGENHLYSYISFSTINFFSGQNKKKKKKNWLALTPGWLVIREIKFDVTWSYVKRHTAKMTSEFVFFSSNPSLNHPEIEKCLLLFATNTNIFTLLFKELKTDGKSFIFAVWHKTT